MRNWYRAAVDKLHRFCQKTAIAWKGASLAMLLVSFLLWGIFSVGYFLTPPHWLTSLLAFVGGLGWFAGVGIVGLLVVGIIYALPTLFSMTLVIALMVICVGFNGLDNHTTLHLAAYILPPIALLGAASAFMFSGGWRKSRRLTRVITGVAFLAGAAGVVTLLAWALDDGQDIERPVDASSTHTVRPLDLENPGKEGSYVVHTLYYGSGTDIRRPEFGKKVTIKTPTVNAWPFMDDWSGWIGWVRTYHWGFTPKEFPLNARVWVPEGKGPFPLVLIVHGNSLMEVNSDAGYSYLGNLLASRGYIVASVDQNFLNASWHCLWKCVGRNNCRGWILLQHLKLWRDWNKDPESQLFGKVDMDNIALIGHSRGGEAVALASAFNHLPYYPDNCNISFDFNFGIRSVIGIAPVDGQYQPTGRHTPLVDVNYLVLHGSYDSDVRAFQGSSQYERVYFDNDADLFKASLYIYGANHGQFNTMWGRYDQWPLEKYLLDVQPMLSGEQQRRIAKVYVSAFLDATLKGNKAYRGLFRDHRSGSRWLPSTIYLTQYADRTYHYISNFEEGLDVTKTAIEGGHQYGENLTIWREHEVCLRYGCIGNRGVYLGWDKTVADGTPNYTVKFPENAVIITPKSSLVFVMADAEEYPIPDEDVPYQTSSQPIDLTVEVTDAAGNTASLPLSHYSGLQPSLAARIWKANFIDDEEASEIVYQSFVFPLRDFVEVNPKFTPSSLTQIRFVFDRTPAWVVVVGDLGIRPY